MGLLSLPEVTCLLASRDVRVCALDLETNGLDPRRSVLACAAIAYGTRSAWAAAVMARTYFAAEPLDPQATRINGLTTEEIERRRGEATYPQMFSDDREMIDFVESCDLVVCHNAGFDLSFLPIGAQTLRFCTMKATTPLVGLRRRSGGLKYPTLSEAARHFDVNQDCATPHESLCDACTADAIFRSVVALAAADKRPCEA